MSKSNTVKIIHIHSNFTFILDSSNFENEDIENEYVFIGIRANYNGIYSDLIRYFNYSPSDLLAVVEICNKADFVILYNLDFAKSYIANRLNKDVTICWRFFGEELYSKIYNKVLTRSTLDSLKNGVLIQKSIISKIIRVINIFRYQTTKSIEYERSIKRIDYFLCLALDEYNFLKGMFDNLPKFVQLPYSIIKKNINPVLVYRPKIIIGNNRSPYNNHLDVISIISNHSNNSKFEFVLLFNYGAESSYSHTVLSAAKQINNMTILNDFLAYSDFQELYRNVGALVINGCRQMAMGNILTAFCSGVKVYLNSQNVILDWLITEGFIVFSMEDFENDLENEDVTLSLEQINNNLNKVTDLRNKYSISDFQYNLLWKQHK